MNKIRLLIVSSMLLLGIGSFLFSYSSIAAPKAKGPTITWTPKSLQETVLAGKTLTIPVSFTASNDLDGVNVEVVPELVPFVSVFPTSFTNIQAGQSVSLSIMFAPSATSTPQAVKGTIHIKDSSSTISKPLPVTLIVDWEKFNDKVNGISFSYPTFGQPSSIESKQNINGAREVRVLETSITPPVVQYIIGETPDASNQSLLEWFGDNVDLSGSILASGSYNLTTLTNGFQVLKIVGELPQQHLDCCGPVDDFYAKSPTGNIVITIDTGWDHDFGSSGITSDEIDKLYLTLLQSIQQTMP